MHRVIKVLLLSLPVIFSTAAWASDDEAALRELKTRLWQQAYRQQDTELLDRILHDSFQMLDAQGHRSTKQQELEWVAANAWNPGEFEYRIERLDIYHGRVAIVDGQGIAEDYRYWSSNVLIKEDGRWQAISSHVSGFEQTD